MTRKESKKTSSSPSSKSRPRAYIRYTNIGVQMLAVIGAGAALGQYLDGRMGNETPYFTAALALLGVIAALYISIKDLIKG